MVTCKECIDVLHDLLDGTLDAELQKHIEEHIGACPPCVEFLATYKTVPRLTRKALAEECPREVALRLKDAIESARAKMR